MQRSTILPFAIVMSLPLAFMVLARSDSPVPIEQGVEVPGTAPISFDDLKSPAAAPDQHRQEECAPSACDVICGLDSCGAGPCDDGQSAKCVCRPNGHGLCGCAPCS